MRYRNIFKMFGNPGPRECESKEAYAEHLLGFFDPSGRYSVTRPSAETTCGSAREINWQRRVWQAALEQYERPDDEPEYAPNDLVLRSSAGFCCSQSKLLDLMRWASAGILSPLSGIKCMPSWGL